MNSAEGIDMAKMAVMILLVVLVIGAVVGLAYMAYGWVTSGSDKLGDTVNSLDSSSYAQYDDAQCAGTDVLTALKSYRDSDIAILIVNSECGTYNSTKADIATSFNYCGLTSEATVYSPADANKDGEGYITKVYYGTTSDTSGVENAYWVPTMQWGDNGLTKRNTNFSPTTAQKMSKCYVRQNAQFYSNLVYNKNTGEVCGILFRQMN